MEPNGLSVASWTGANEVRGFRWFAGITAVTIGFQLLRLMQHDPVSWLIVDYAMRVSGLALLAVSPMRSAIFCTEPLRVPRWMLLVLVPGGVIAMILFFQVQEALSAGLSNTSLDQYPAVGGWVRRFDLTFGLALVALHEELIFRRFARFIFRRLGDGAMLVIITSLVFAMYHWWTGVPNILGTAASGVLLMLVYRAAGALWPAVAIHYLVDLYAFA